MKFGAQRLEHEDVLYDVVGIEREACHRRPERQAARLGNPGECAAAGSGRGGWRGVGQADSKYHEARVGRFHACVTLIAWGPRFRRSSLRAATIRWSRWIISNSARRRALFSACWAPMARARARSSKC